MREEERRKRLEVRAAKQEVQGQRLQPAVNARGKKREVRG